MNNLFVYQSCLPLNVFSVKNTEIIQTSKISEVNLSGEIFKDSLGNCWSYLGEYDENYISPFSVFPIYFSGNYFNNIINIKYPDCDTCNTTVTSSCTEVFFSAVKCDTSEVIDVKICNVGPIVGNLKLMPNLGDVCGIRNPSGNDFCVTITGQSQNTTTNYEIVTPAWQYYDCDTCPVYKTYTVDSCDLSVTGLTVYDLSANTTLSSGDTITITSDELCYQIISYDGVVVEYNALDSEAPFVQSSFNSCNDCLNYYYSV